MAVDLWLTALHILTVIAWMGGMLYLPRLYVYHVQAEPGSAQSETFKMMEGRLLRAVINPAMIAAWATGLTLAWRGDLWMEGWFDAKLALLLAMQIVHAGFGRWRRQFAADANRHGAGFYRAMHHTPTLLMIGIVVLAVVRPF